MYLVEGSKLHDDNVYSMMQFSLNTIPLSRFYLYIYELEKKYKMIF